jgi:hypothetical protein
VRSSFTFTAADWVFRNGHQAKVVSLIWILLSFSFVGPALYGVFFMLGTIGVDIFIGRFQWSQLWAVFGIFVVALFFEFIFWASFFSDAYDGLHQFLLPTYSAAFGFWFLHWQYLEDSARLSKFWFVASRAFAGSIVYLAAYLVFNPIFIDPGWDALYFFKLTVRPEPDYSEWGGLNDYGQLFGLSVLVLTGLCLGAFLGLQSAWFGKPADNLSLPAKGTSASR